jgi:hypothetical protein
MTLNISMDIPSTCPASPNYLFRYLNIQCSQAQKSEGTGQKLQRQDHMHAARIFCHLESAIRSSVQLTQEDCASSRHLSVDPDRYPSTSVIYKKLPAHIQKFPSGGKSTTDTRHREFIPTYLCSSMIHVSYVVHRRTNR